MKSKDFIAILRNIATGFYTVYMWGTFGAPVTEATISYKSQQYPDFYTAAKQAELRKLIGKNYFAFDCVGLIKGVLWGWLGFQPPSYTQGGAVYASKGVPDISADGMLSVLTDVSRDFSNIVPGEAVWMPGHIGVYIGDGKVVESTTQWSNNVQITACLNIGWIAGLNGRTWHVHGKLPYVEYEPVTPGLYTVVTGDSLWSIAYKFLGNGALYPQIKELNNMTTDTIRPGQQLKIPTK